MGDSLYKFDVYAVRQDPTGYYFPRWDKCERLTIIATTRAEACKKAEHVLGGTKRSEWPWAFQFGKIEAIDPSLNVS